jgi:ATP-dependent protease ClpP protease subunit
MDYKIEKKTNSSGHTLNVVHMSGLIDAKEVRRWLAVTSELDRNLDTLFVLDSPGGNVPMGLFTIKKVDEFIALQTQKLRHTWIAIEGQCSSMCIPLFFAWPNRFAVQNTKIGLHGVSDGGLGFDSESTQFYLNSIKDHALARKESAVIAWINQMEAKGEFSSSVLTPFPVQDLAGFLPSENIVSSTDQLMDLL